MRQMLPVKRTKTQAQRFYDRISRVYDALTVSEKRLIRRGVDLLAIQPGESVLEIGCGTGTGLHFIINAAQGVNSVIGLDLSRKMLMQSLSKNIPGKPVPLLIQGDGARLPIISGEIDAILMTFTLELFSAANIGSVLRECRRVLKHGGRLAVVSLAGSPHTLSLRIYELAHQLFPIAVDCRPIPLVELLAENGYQILSAEKIMNWGLPVLLTVSTLHHSD
jgi:demethylmenaquinone methyltransferase/2-methoxy-6-polyprenyl-1,4-benzoquinol methylase